MAPGQLGANYGGGMAPIPPKNPITRLLNRIPFTGLWFKWFAYTGPQKWLAGTILGACAIGLLAFDGMWYAVGFALKELSGEVMMEAIQRLFS